VIDVDAGKVSCIYTLGRVFDTLLQNLKLKRPGLRRTRENDLPLIS
jgi:hypothetical protein